MVTARASNALGILLALGLGACGQAGSGNESMPANETAAQADPAMPGTAEPGDLENAAPADNGISSTMPVPGTNTPEHIVVNNDVDPNAIDGL
ncbi:MAG: hypothetical protein ACLGHC_07300 [Alphaproteobacteria bacterium]